VSENWREWEGDGQWGELWRAFSRRRGVSRPSRRVQHSHPLRSPAPSHGKTAESNVLVGPSFFVHLGCFKNHVVHGIFFQTTNF
jgi:hypothetical protein